HQRITRTFFRKFYCAFTLQRRLRRAAVVADAVVLRMRNPCFSGEAECNKFNGSLRQAKRVSALVRVVEVTQNALDASLPDVCRDGDAMFLAEVAKVDSMFEEKIAHTIALLGREEGRGFAPEFTEQPLNVADSDRLGTAKRGSSKISSGLGRQ